MRSRRLRKLKDRLLSVIIVVAGVVAGYLGYDQQRDAIQGAALDNARHSAVAFLSPELRALTGKRADASTPAFAAVSERLRRFQETDPKIRGVRIFRFLPSADTTVTLADGSPQDAPDHLQPGDPFPAAATSPNLQTAMRTGEAVVDGPSGQGLDAILTGYAPIGAKGAPTAPRDFLGMDMEVAHWNRDLFLAAAGPAVLVWMILGLPFVGYILIRRELEQGEAIRNLSEAIEQSRSAVMIIDLNGEIEYANRGLCEQLGCKRRDLIGQHWTNFQVTDKERRDDDDIVVAVNSGKPWSGEWFNRRRDNTVYAVRGAFTPVRRKSGRLACYIATFDDMTESKRNEMVLRESKERAEAGETAKSQFLATMSHEVRTPLNGIIGFTSLLLDTPLTPEQRDFVQTIQLSSEALIQLTGDILDFARIESGKLKLEPQPCSPRECVDDALDSVATKAAAKGIELLHWVDDVVPETIYADGNRLRQILMNLIGNAVKFTERGEVELRVRAEKSGANGQMRLIFSVRDTGVGIPPEQHEKLFKPFTQLDNALTRRHGGTGLGLAICKNIVELMGGQVFLKSAPGLGSVFSFTVGVESNPVVTDHKPFPLLEHLRLAIAAPEGPTRDELARLGRRFGATLVETTPALLAATSGWDVALLDLDAMRIGELVAESRPSPDLPPERVFGLVPLSLPSATRAALRVHFRLLVNKPIHHEALYSLLATAVETPVSLPARREPTGLRVLLVEDDAVNQLLMQKQLTAVGCEWVKADNGRLALLELSRKRFDFVLMDLYMPEMDGVDAIKQIRSGRAGEPARDVWIAALTADARTDQKERTLEIGANDYLVKPVALPALRVALEKFAIARRTKR
ncbi:MAG: sensor hybrid histidine kinase [Verrucomicrobia bacterium]|nr:sensor hybrid histidine kinase [Verrucomicrobiota bacterium]